MTIQVTGRYCGGEFHDSVVEEVESLDLPGKQLNYLQNSGLEVT